MFVLMPVECARLVDTTPLSTTGEIEGIEVPDPAGLLLDVHRQHGFGGRGGTRTEYQRGAQSRRCQPWRPAQKIAQSVFLHSHMQFPPVDFE